jgi:dethiobiotin synthetase
MSALPTTALFVTGVGTDIGKTVAACALIAAARADGRPIEAYKPVLSGYDASDAAGSDAGRLLTALGEPVAQAGLDRIAPLRFAAPLSPPDAAAREDAVLTLDQLEEACRLRLAQAALAGQALLIEGAGGVMSPIAGDGLNLDLIRRLGVPTVLCAANYLGVISHVLTALEALRAFRLPVLAVVVQDLAPGAGPALVDTVRAVRQYSLGVPVLSGAGWPAQLLVKLR